MNNVNWQERPAINKKDDDVQAWSCPLINHARTGLFRVGESPLLLLNMVSPAPRPVPWHVGFPAKEKCTTAPAPSNNGLERLSNRGWWTRNECGISTACPWSQARMTAHRQARTQGASPPVCNRHTCGLRFPNSSWLAVALAPGRPFCRRVFDFVQPNCIGNTKNSSWFLFACTLIGTDEMFCRRFSP